MVLLVAGLASFIFALQGLAQTSTPSGDTTPPSMPTSLSAYVNSSTQISISWAGAMTEEGVTGWKIYRDGVEIGWKSSATTPAYSNTSLSPGTTYTYTVAAQDAAGNLSPQSVAVSATTQSLPQGHVCGTSISVPQNYASIQSALNAACSGDTIFVSAGTYQENLVIPKANLILKGAPGTTPASVIIDGSGEIKNVVSTAYSFTIEGMTLQGAKLVYALPGSVGLDISPPSSFSSVSITARSMVIRDNNYGIRINSTVTGGTLMFDGNVIVNNRLNGIDISSWGTATVYILNNTIAGSAGTTGAGINEHGGGGTHVLKNNIIVNHTYGIRVDCNTPPFSIQYNDVWNNYGGNYMRFSCPLSYNDGPFTPSPATGEISKDPLFVNSSDFHLQSASPAINTGDPSILDRDGSRSDMGGYGGPNSATGGDSVGGSSDTTPLADTTPPSVPTYISVTPLSSTSTQISWLASTDNVGVSVYRVYRNGVEIGLVYPPYAFYINAGLSPGTSYSYTVAAQDAAGNLSPQSAPVSATTLSSATLTVPAKPSIFTAYASDSNVSLYWQGNYPYPTPESEAKVYRRLQGSSSWILIYSRSYNPAYINYDRYTDAGLANATYEYHINICNSGGCSADSNTVTVTVGAVATATTTSSLSPIGYWKFDGNGNNEIAGGPSAAIVGNASFNSSGGKLGGYAYIPGSSDWLKIPYNSIFDLPDNFTIEFWFRQRADRSFLQDLVYKGTPLNNYNFRVFRQLWNQYNYGPVIAGHTAANTGFWTQPSNPNQLAHNEWHHVAFTKSPSYHAYYLDGALIGSLNLSQSGSAEYSGPAKTPHNDIIIGDSAVDTDIDNLRIYNRSLSLDEVLTNGGFSARVRVCEQGAKQCSGNNIQECSSDGYSWNFTQYCSYSCNSNTLSCSSVPTTTSTTSTATTAPSPTPVITSPPPATTPFSTNFTCPNGAIVPVGNTCPSSSTTSTPAQPTSTPITQCLQAGGLWCYSDYPTSLSGYCAPAKSACERGDQSPRAVLPQPTAVGLRASDQFLADRRAILHDLRELERLVRRDIIEIDAKQLKIYKEKILSLKAGNEGDLSVLQNYREQITSLQSEAPTNTERESTIDPRQEARALQQLKQGLRLFERHIATMEKKVTQIKKSGVTVDAVIIETIAKAKDMAQQVKKAKSYDEIRDVVEQMPDVGQALNDALPRLEELLRLPRVLRLVDRRIADGEKAIKQASALAKRLKLDVAENLEAMRGIITNAKSTIVAVKTGGATEGLLDTLQEQVFDPLDEIFDLADNIRAVASIRQSVNQATANVKRYEARLRRLPAGSEDRQTASELLVKFKEQLAGLKGLSAQKLTADIGDQIIDLLNVMEDLKTELEDTLGLSSPDATAEQIKRLFSGPGEKIKPFKVEQLEQGVL